MKTIGSIGYELDPFICLAPPAVAPFDWNRQRKGDRNSGQDGHRADDAPGADDMPGSGAAPEQSAASPQHKLNLTA